MDDNNASGAVRSAIDTVKEKTGVERAALEEQVKALQEQVEELKKSLSAKGQEIASKVTDKAKEATEITSSTIREYPVTAVLGAAAIGAVVAMLFRQGYDQRRSSYHPEDLLSDLGHRLSSLKSRVM